MNEFSEKEQRERFLMEYRRVKNTGAFFTDEEFCHSLGRHRNWISQLTGPEPVRYCINTKDLYYSFVKWDFDLIFIVGGGAKAKIRALLPSLEELKHRGQHKRGKK